MTEGFTNGPLQKLHVDLYIYADAVRLEVAAASPLCGWHLARAGPVKEFADSRVSKMT